MSTFIAEVKTRSPWGWRSDKTWDELFEIANELGDWVAVHTDPRWGGSFDLLRAARRRTDKPLLAKGIHDSDAALTEALALGADYVLCVGRVPLAIGRVLVEPFSIAGLNRMVRPGIKIVWNTRDLFTGALKTETFEEARRVYGGWMCQASNLRSPADVHPQADAFLVGTALAEWSEHQGKVVTVQTVAGGKPS